MSANVDLRTGVSRRLERIPETPAPLTDRDVGERSLLVRLFSDLIRRVAGLEGAWRPRRVDFANVVLDATGTTKFRLEHRFASSVRFWVVDWNGAAAPNVRSDASSTADTLVVTSTSAGTAAIRVEESG